MQIRIVKETELWNVLNFSAQMFWKQDLMRYTEEGKDEFLKFLKYEEQLERFRAGEILLFAAFEQEKVCGAMELDTKGKILFLYADSIERMEKTAGAMVYEACRFANASGMYQSLHAEVGSEKEPMYRQLGFVPCGEVLWEHGMPRRQMQLDILSKLPQGAPKKKSNTWIYVAVAAGATVLVVMLLFGILVSFIMKQAGENFRENYSIEKEIPGYGRWDDNDEWNDSDRWNDNEDRDDRDDGRDNDDRGDNNPDSSDNDNSVAENNDGIMSLDAYIDPNAGYEAKEQNEQFQSDEMSRYFVAYDINYPEINGLPQDVEAKVNEALKKCAMETIDRYYMNPSEEIKEWMLRQPHAIIISQVNYIVSYMDEDLLSVAFEDVYTAGNYNASYVGLRSVIVNVKDGTVYEMKDVLDMNRDFANMWKAEVMSEYPDNEFASAYGVGELEELFGGKDAEKGTRPVMILTEEGIEIGFEYRVPGADGTDRTGYLTVVFEQDDLRRYQKSPNFWKKVKND